VGVLEGLADAVGEEGHHLGVQIVLLAEERGQLRGLVAVSRGEVEGASVLELHFQPEQLAVSGERWAWLCLRPVILKQLCAEAGAAEILAVRLHV
jgi:hypothetical protein